MNLPGAKAPPEVPKKTLCACGKCAIYNETEHLYECECGRRFKAWHPLERQG